MNADEELAITHNDKTIKLSFAKTQMNFSHLKH